MLTQKQFGPCTSFVDVLIRLQLNEVCGSNLSDIIDFKVTHNSSKKSARPLMAAKMANSACV